MFYKRPLRSQKLVVYPPAILSRAHLAHVGFLSSFFFFFFLLFFLIHPRPIGTRTRRLWTNARSTALVHDLCPLIPSPRARDFISRLSRFDYLLGEAYRLLIYSAVTNYDDLAGQRRYLFPLVRTSGFWWKRDRLELVSREERTPSPHGERNTELSVVSITWRSSVW